jgi:hypothetical protein
MTVSEINIFYGAQPVEIDPKHRVVLIRINRNFERDMTDDELFEATRKWWIVGPKKREIGTPSAPQWAMSVYGGIVRAVYQIERWEQPTPEEIAIDPKRIRRWAFRGKRDLEIEEKYLHRDVSSYLRSLDGIASQNPIRYVHCVAK